MLRYQVSHVPSRTPFSTLRTTSTRDCAHTHCTLHATRSIVEEGGGKSLVLSRGFITFHRVFFTYTHWLDVKLLARIRILEAHFLKGLGNEVSLTLPRQSR